MGDGTDRDKTMRMSNAPDGMGPFGGLASDGEVAVTRHALRDLVMVLLGVGIGLVLAPVLFL